MAKTLHSFCVFIWKAVCSSVQDYTVPFFCLQCCQFMEHLYTVVRTNDTLVEAEKRVIKMFPQVRITLLENYGSLLAFDLFMYCNFMVSCNRKFKSQFTSTMFNNISVTGGTEHANAGAVMLFANRQLELPNQGLSKHDFKYTMKLFKTI